MLYFLAGMLPDPEGPWNPTAAHCSAWITGASMEAVIAAVLSSTQTSLAVSKAFVDELRILGASRLAVFVLMAAVLIFRDYKLRPSAAKALPEERQSLLENGNAPSSNYATVPDSKPAADSAKGSPTAGMSWLTYIASFRVLFPYIWCARRSFIAIMLTQN